jgi:hypothetical protein
MIANMLRQCLVDHGFFRRIIMFTHGCIEIGPLRIAEGCLRRADIDLSGGCLRAG